MRRCKFTKQITRATKRKMAGDGDHFREILQRPLSIDNGRFSLVKCIRSSGMNAGGAILCVHFLSKCPATLVYI